MIDLAKVISTLTEQGRALEKAENQPKVEMKDVGGHLYTVTKNGLLPHVGPNYPTVTVSTLAGLGDLITSDDEREACFVVIKSHTEVSYQSAPDTVQHMRRNVFGVAHAIVPKQFRFEQYMDAETFIVELLSRFEQTDDRDSILKLIGSMTSGTMRTADDDGITQQVTVRAGVALKGAVEVRNPVVLKPYRTFHDIDQPASPFILRFKQDGENKPTAALFEADGGKWQVDALRAIHARLKEILPKDVIVLA